MLRWPEQFAGLPGHSCFGASEAGCGLTCASAPASWTPRRRWRRWRRRCGRSP